MKLTKLYFENAAAYIEPFTKRFKSFLYKYALILLLTVPVSIIYAAISVFYWLFIICVPTWLIFTCIDLLILCPAIPRLLERFFTVLWQCLKFLFKLICTPLRLVFTTLLSILVYYDLEK